MKLHTLKSQNDFCSFRRVICFLARCFKLLSFFTFIFAFFSNFRIYNRYTTPFSIYGRPICYRADHYIFALCFLSFFPRLISTVGDWMSVYHTSTHGVALVRIYNAWLKPAARGSLKTQDAKKSPKIAIWAPSHNFVGLFLRN